MSMERDLEFLYELGSFRYMPRGWVQTLGGKPASVMEHTLRVMFIALAIARKEGKGDENLVMRMALVHDLAEARVTDHGYVSKVYVTADEDKAAHEQLEGTIFADLEAVLHQYEERKCIEAKIVKDADNLDIDIEMKEFEEMGSQLPKKWAGLRKDLRDNKLYTQAAKDMWDAIQTSEPSSWHMATNKYKRIPESGL